MTTIIYHKGWLYADGQVTRNSTVVEMNARKVRKFDDGTIIAFCGDLNQFEPFIEWYFDNTKPRPPMVYGDQLSGAVVLNNNGVWDYDIHGFALIEEEYCAWGSGGPIALGALDAGKSPREAMQIACNRDIYSGGEITAFKGP